MIISFWFQLTIKDFFTKACKIGNIHIKQNLGSDDAFIKKKKTTPNKFILEDNSEIQLGFINSLILEMKVIKLMRMSMT